MTSTLRNRHSILPVIHVESLDQALRNTDAARKSGCDGVFLINHGIPAHVLLDVHRAVSAAHPGWWIGVNCLDLSPHEVFSRLSADVAGVWVDNARIDERAEKQSQADAVSRARATSGWQGLYFGGVAFKYQRTPEDLAGAARAATRYMDVVTTSGPGTGHSASTDKLAVMRQAVGDFPLALASGITVDNVYSYLPYVDYLLVATGVSSSWTELDPVKLSDLVSSVRLYRPAGD